VAPSPPLVVTDTASMAAAGVPLPGAARFAQVLAEQRLAAATGAADFQVVEAFEVA
jgi:hypothetical protein